ncbi:hypothetical protein ACFE04_006617 [Oxalis oulophora]
MDGVIKRFMFEKRLSQTDVGKLNQLVVPKRLALKFLPHIPATRNVDQVNSREVVFYDKLMKAWQFKYSYWTANRTLNPAKPAEDFLMIKTQAGSIKLLGKTILS